MALRRTRAIRLLGTMACGAAVLGVCLGCGPSRHGSDGSTASSGVAQSTDTTTADSAEPTDPATPTDPGPPTTGPASPTASPSDTTPADSGVGTPTADGSLLGTYAVAISGTVSGNSFTRNGTVTLEPTITTVGTNNGVNPVDACLVSGFPAAQPEPGAIWLGSNSACDPGASAADIDLAYVTVDGPTVTVGPDERIAATEGNNLTATSGLAACLYTPVSGQMTLAPTPGGSITGQVNITAYGGVDCGTISYTATITGQRQ